MNFLYVLFNKNNKETIISKIFKITESEINKIIEQNKNNENTKSITDIKDEQFKKDIKR